MARIDDLLPDFHPFDQKEPAADFSAQYDWQQPSAPPKQPDFQSHEDSRPKADGAADLIDLGAFTPYADDTPYDDDWADTTDDWADTTRLEYDSFWDRVMEDDERVWVVAFIDPKDPACQRFVP